MTKENTNLNPALKEPSHLWDEILKTQAHRMPKQLILLINEVFQKNYPLDSNITFLGTEYDSLKKDEHTSVEADLIFKVNDAETYHIESELSDEDDVMCIRIMEYSFSTALLHDTLTDPDTKMLRIRLPASVVIYPAVRHSRPTSLNCELIFPDGTSHIHKIPVISVQNYSLKDIFEKHLSLLLPYTLHRFVPRLNSKRNPLRKNELTDFLNEFIVGLEAEVSNGYLTKKDFSNTLDLLELASERIFAKYDGFKKEVSHMYKSSIVFTSDLIEERVRRETEEKMQALIKEKDDLFQTLLNEKDDMIKSLQEQLAAAKNKE